MAKRRIQRYAIVTGASPSSIGFIAAQKLATDPDRRVDVVVLACRDEKKGLAAKHQILQSVAKESIRQSSMASAVVYLHLDLSSFESIHKFVDEFHGMIQAKKITLPPDGENFSLPVSDEEEEVVGRLKILINNAGVGFGRETPYCQTEDGLEEIVGVNHFGTFLLTQLLLKDLQTPGSIKNEKSTEKEEESRIVIVSSSLHGKSRSKKTEDVDGSSKANLILPEFPIGLLQTDKDSYDGFQAYKASKLCNLWFTYELQRQLLVYDEQKAAVKVKVNAVSPGFIPTTGLSRRAGWMGQLFLQYVLDPWRYIGLGITRSPEDGAEAIVQAATSNVASQGGQYFHLPKGEASIVPISSSDESMDEQKARELWEISMKTCKLT